LRKCRLQNCVNKRKNPILEESLSIFIIKDIIYALIYIYYTYFFSDKLKVLWQQKLIEYSKEEEELKYMLSKAEAKKHKKREIEIQEKLSDWDKVLFGPNYRSHEILLDINTFLDIR